jgi:outer membrane immunogenic protein
MVRSEFKLKKILLGVALLGATSTAALAADLPSRRAPPVYVAPMAAPVFTWTGFYIGGNAGYAFDNKTSFATTVGPATSFVQSKTNGFTGGGQIGYNWQLGNAGLGTLPGLGGGVGGGIVLGVEADAAYTDLSTSTVLGGAPFFAHTQFVGTARGRVGYAFGNVLIYGTGGFAYGGINDGAGTAVANKIATGYAYGGGIEYAIPTSSFINVFHSSAVTLKAEYLHYDLGTQTVVSGPISSSIKNNGNLVRAGINYKFDLFGVPAAPVVARY